MYKILIVEDDEIIANSVCSHISSWGLQAKCASDFEHIIDEFVSFDPQLVLLDLSLPFYNGYHWCEEIRKISKVPIIFISSAGENMNIVMAMSAGADDFISKPFDLSVLTAKIQAMLRRTYDFAGQTTFLEHNGVVLNVGESTVSYKDKKAELSKNECRILHVLFENKGRIVSRDMLMNALWQTDSFVDENTLSVNVTRLRKRLESIGVENFILTKKGAGYTVK